MRVTEAMIEAAAKALYRQDGPGWAYEGNIYKNAYRRSARIALNAAAKAPKSRKTKRKD